MVPASTRAWVTLLTRSSYLAGAILLAHSLEKHNSAYPLIILYTPTLPSSCLAGLRHECALSNALLVPTTILTPREQITNHIAARFEDTWTKLRVFELVDYERLVFLDADMMVFRNMDELFDVPLPGPGWLGANHACVCNLDRDSWAPADWTRENCAYTGLRHPDALSAPCPAPKRGEGRRTHHLLNSGMFVFSPSADLWADMLAFLDTTPLLKTFMFPDQDFLTEFFRGRWLSLGWQYNALKTMRYWHADMWRDDEVRNLHYIVDKPWSCRVGDDGVAGYLGRDGETHRWWWDEYERWEKARVEGNEEEILALMRANVARPVENGKPPEALHGNWKAGGDAQS